MVRTLCIDLITLVVKYLYISKFFFFYLYIDKANNADSILLQEAATWDPFLEYVMLGDKIEDGVLAWYQLGLFARNYGCRVQLQGGRREARSRQIFPGEFPTAYQPTQETGRSKSMRGVKQVAHQMPISSQKLSEQCNNTASVYRFFFREYNDHNIRLIAN
jgi:hypothetical protein